jgi:HEAT repeat protein
MRQAISASMVIPAFALLLVGCNKSGPAGSAASSSSTAPAPVEYDLAKLTADLKSSTQGRRDKAVQNAIEMDADGEEVVPTLLEALKDPTCGELGKSSPSRIGSTREAAVKALLDLKAKGKKALLETGLKTLEAGLTDSKANVREYTANAIGMIGTDAKSSAPALTALCVDRDRWVRTTAYSALERMRPIPPGPILKLLSHPDAAIASEAASALSWLKSTGPDAVPPLLDALRRESREKDDPADLSHIRNAASEALAGVGSGAEAAVPALVEVLIKSKADDVDRMSRPMRPGDRAATVSGPITALRRMGKPAIDAVKPLLKHEEAIVRYQAAAVFSGMGPAGADALPDVIAALEVERALPTGQMYVFEELAAAALSLGSDADKITTQAITLLNNNEAGVRYRAAKLLARIGRKAAPAVSKLGELLDDPEPAVQSAAIQALAAIGPAAKPALPDLAKKVSDDDVGIAREATRSLRVFGADAAVAVSALTKALASNDQNFCIEAAQALAAIGPPAAEAVPTLAKQLANPQSRRDEKEAFLQAIAAIGPNAQDAIPAVIKVAGERDPMLRGVAARTLARIGIGNPEAVKKLTDMLKDSTFSVQLAALKAIGSMGPAATAATSEMKTYLATTNDPVAKIWAAAALVALGSDGDANLKLIQAAIKDKTPGGRSMRVAAIDSVEILGLKAKPAVPDLLDALKDKGPIVGTRPPEQVRERAAKALGQLGAKEAISPLTDMLRDSERGARRAAAEALGAIGADAVVAAAKLRDLARSDPALADVAREALDRIEPPKKSD